MLARLQGLSRVLLILAIFYAPWAFGCTERFAEVGLLLILSCAIFLWFSVSLLQFHIPRIPLLLFITLLFLFSFGWFMALNGHFLHDDNLMRFTPIVSFWPSAPGSCEKSLSILSMQRITLLLGTVWMTADIVQNAVWRKRIFMAMALAGCSIALLGLIQRAFHAPGIFGIEQSQEQIFFAAYQYHANAGAYLNLTLPLLGGLWISSMIREGRRFQKLLWGIGIILLLTASVVNTSRGAEAVTGFLFISFILWQRNFLWRFFKHVPKILFLIVGILCLLTLGALVISTGIHLSLERWQLLPEQLGTLEMRLPAQQAWTHIIPQSGYWGMGVGTFRAVSSYFKHYGGEEVSYLWWKNAHEDYLQTLIEWGYVGTFFWAILFLGALLTAARYLRRKIEVTGRTNRLFIGSATLAILGVMIHATYDYPLQICSIQFYVAILLGTMWSPSFGWIRAKHHN